MTLSCVITRVSSWNRKTRRNSAIYQSSLDRIMYAPDGIASEHQTL